MSTAREAVAELLSRNAEGLAENPEWYYVPASCRAMRAGMAIDPRNPERARLTAENTQELRALIADAEHDLIAWTALYRIVEDLFEFGQSIPEPLAGFVLQMMQGNIKRPKLGRNKGPKGMRNLVIRLAVYEASELGVTPTRSTAPVSACDLVADCLQIHGIYLSYDAVKKIWDENPVHPYRDRGKDDENISPMT